MDHKVSKDMISSGMIPSGEKNQADLGRTQYGSAPSPSKLMDAYKSMYEHHKKDADGNTIPHEGEELNEVGFLAPLLGGVTGGAGKAAVGAGAKAAAGAAAKSAAGMGTFGKAAATGATKTGGMLSKGKELVKTGIDKFKKMDSFQKYQTYQMGKDALNTAGAAAKGVKGATTVRKGNTGTVSADVDLFDIVKGQLLDEGLSEEEIRDIMLTLTPDEILKEIEESSMSAGEGADRHMGTDDVARTKQQIGNMFNKNVPKKENTGGKVDKVTRKAINTSARDLGIQGPTTLKQSVEPEGETI